VRAAEGQGGQLVTQVTSGNFIFCTFTVPLWIPSQVVGCAPLQLTKGTS